MMARILIACEESQTVTKQFRLLGHAAYSCDIIPCSGDFPEWHIHDDVLNHLNAEWDLMIAHPPCTYLTNAGIGWFNETKYGNTAKQRKFLREKAFDFVLKLMDANIPKIALENPVGYINTAYRKPDQIIQPYWFGDPESKRTCLWLKNLPKLTPTNIVQPNVYSYRSDGRPIYFVDSIKQSKLRSKTFNGIAKAMAEQWSILL